jgi:hypothetical protein
MGVALPRCWLIFGVLSALLSCGRSAEREHAAGSAAHAAPDVEVSSAPRSAALQQAGGQKAITPRSTCEACRARWCSNFEGVDLVAGCFEAPDPKVVPNPDPQFAATCSAVMRCAFEHDCAYDAARGPVHCYCGSRHVDECKINGPALDAPCVKEWQAAARSQDNLEVLLRFDQVQYPSGWAFHLLQCDRERCGKSSPLGRCTP